MKNCNFDRLIEDIRARLSGPLPGLESQMRMATMRRIIHDGQVKIPPDARMAGVLVLFYPWDGEIFIPFIKRNEYPGVHSGQVSFPGGAQEEGDSDLYATALRETEEEIGVSRQMVHVIGQMTNLYIPPSNFNVTPVVGFVENRPRFTPDPGEVERIIEIPVSTLLRHDTITEKQITIFPDIRLRVPCFFYNEEVIWGATAMMLSELIEVIRPRS